MYGKKRFVIYKKDLSALYLSQISIFKNLIFNITVFFLVPLFSIFPFYFLSTLQAITQFSSFIASFRALKSVCNTFPNPAFPYSPGMKYLLTESNRFVRRDLKTPAMTDRECVLTQSWTESHSIFHRLLKGCNQIGYLRAHCVVMTSNHSVCFHKSSHWDYYPPLNRSR